MLTRMLKFVPKMSLLADVLVSTLCNVHYGLSPSNQELFLYENNTWVLYEKMFCYDSRVYTVIFYNENKFAIIAK